MKLKTIKIQICEACLDGIGEECHTPGCALFLHSVDSLGIDENIYEVLRVDEFDDTQTDTHDKPITREEILTWDAPERVKKEAGDIMRRSDIKHDKPCSDREDCAGDPNESRCGINETTCPHQVLEGNYLYGGGDCPQCHKCQEKE